MKKKILILGLITSLVLFSVTAEKRIDEKELGNVNSWQEDFGLDGRKSGKYNVIVTATDKAGNQTMAGPFNIRVDSESDLPVATITSPSEQMRVTGGLSIVGTCADDDKVTEVYLIFDGDSEHPVLAKGTDYWSYYLDTTNLKEGPHTIEAYGVDNGNPEAYVGEGGVVDESKVIPKKGNSVTVTWQLDRRAPVTVVENHENGGLFGGRNSFTGYVKDGNGIALLEYSLDGGEFYQEVKLSEKKLSEIGEDGVSAHYKFNIPIDTKKMEDGPAIIWFRAVDNAGTVGLSSFLYFVDNTDPDVKILTPEINDKVNGKFTVAGFAKDANGIQGNVLNWSWGDQGGVFNMTPGNPYWSMELNSTGITKVPEFTISCTDRAGNLVTARRVFNVDQNGDKPLVTVLNPLDNGSISGKAGSLFIRGYATDDDAVKSVTYSIDDGEAITVDTRGAFDISVPTAVSNGLHTIKIYATDRNDLKGDDVLVTFSATGIAPIFGRPVLTKGDEKNGLDVYHFEDGMLINPEDSFNYSLSIVSSSSFASIQYSIENMGESSDFKDLLSLPCEDKFYTVSIPVSSIPWGVTKLCVRAEDIFGQVSEYYSVLHAADLSKPWTNEPGVYFEDSTVSADGGILLDTSHPVSGYFIGGKAVKVEIVPPARAATARLDGNNIILDFNQAAESDPCVIRVTTDKGAVYNSKTVYFRKETLPPVITLEGENSDREVTGLPFEFQGNSRLEIKGNVSMDPASTVVYRILSAQAQMVDGFVVSSKQNPVPSFEESVPVSTRRSGSFSLTLRSEDFTEGVSIVEIIARNSSGIDSSVSVPVRKIPYARTELNEGETELPKSAPPVIYWFRGNETYAVALYQYNLDNVFKAYKRADLPIGENKVTFTTTATENVDGKVTSISSSASVTRNGDISVQLNALDGLPYISGSQVYMKKGASSAEGHKLTLYIEAQSAIKEVSYTIKNRFTSSAGGNGNQKGNVLARSMDTYYEADIPLENLPAGITDIEVSVKDSRGSVAKASGVLNVLRDPVTADDEAKVYWAPLTGAVYDSESNRYILNDGAYLSGFINVPGEISRASLTRNINGLSVSVEGHRVSVKASQDGIYQNVAVNVYDAAGGSYSSLPVTLVVDGSSPVLSYTGPENMSWVKNSMVLSGNASDGNGLAYLKYSLSSYDGGAVSDSDSSWKLISVQKNGSFSERVDLSAIEDGYIPLNIMAMDTAGKKTYFHAALHKDTTPPEVKVILPEPGTVINGESMIVFSVKDNTALETINFTGPNGAYKETFNYNEKIAEGEEVEEGKRFMLQSMPSITVGKGNRPNDERNVFTFTDAAGNSTVMNSWEFSVDPASDLPVAEIHLPVEDSVITTDFIVSGVIYDDDGESSIEWRMDGGPWQVLKDETTQEKKMGYQFEIPVSLSQMTDNEHVVSVRAYDINGTRGPETQNHFKVSLEEPKGSVDSPTIDKTIKGRVTLRGSASDKNGIKKVQVSIDNGATYNDAEGLTNWSYTFDSNIIHDGTHAIFVKIYDSYDITGLYSSLLNVDNTPPNLRLELPLDDSTTTKELFFSGQTTDNIGLTALYITVRSLDPSHSVSRELQRIDLQADEIITQTIDLSALSNGFYNISLTGEDAAGNTTRVSRNIQLDKNVPLTTVNLLYPLNGETVRGKFNLYGSVETLEEDVVSVKLFIDGQEVNALAPAKVSESGFFKFALKSNIVKAGEKVSDADGNEYTTDKVEYELTEGSHTYYALATTESGKTIKSNEHTFYYSKYGPWVTLDNFDYGDFAMDRPMIRGDAGYALTDEEAQALKDKNTRSDIKAALQAKTISRVYLSLDNGRSYSPVSRNGTGKWNYRIENEDIEAGYHYLLVKAVMKNGETAITRTIVQVDRTSPEIRMISPGIGGHYNQLLEYSGLASDDVALKDVKLTLREGDKSAYEIPEFVQGLYFDVSVWGATLYDVGVGLTFFDDVVKVQANFGQFTQGQRDAVSKALSVEETRLRFGGNVFGARIIAQVYNLPMRYFFGRDFDWLSATFSLGANFSYFSESGATESGGESIAQVLTAAFAQIEFPRMTFKNLKYFNTWAIYTEPQIWIIPSDVNSRDARRYVPTVSLGIHANVF